MKRWGSAVFLLIFFWLQTYQLCDASEDFVEDLPVATQGLSPQRLSLSAPVPPDNDDDGAIPSVFDQTLMQGGEHVAPLLVTVEWKALPHPATLASLIVVPDSRSLSPPNDRAPCPVGHSNDVFIPSHSILAPPLL